MKDIQLKQVSKILKNTGEIPSIPKKGWIFTLRNTLGMTISSAASRANVSTAAWSNAEKREAEGTITIATLTKFLSALGFDFRYLPQSGMDLESIIKQQTVRYASKEIQKISSTMALEDQKPAEKFSNKRIQEKADDIYRSSNWKEIWK